jgi:hypothetical protein
MPWGFWSFNKEIHSLTDKHKVIRELMEVINGRIELLMFRQVGRRITNTLNKGGWASRYCLPGSVFGVITKGYKDAVTRRKEGYEDAITRRKESGWSSLKCFRLDNTTTHHQP